MTAPVSAATVSDAETRDRLRRGRSLPCPKCEAPAGDTCRQPDGSPTTTHSARWVAWYAAHPETSTS